ncbi:MAG: transporter substrate-binding domain-containing protein [Pseudomonadales bacterium]|nr:transporter substrate-binding domain-containing protein [Pseudomonadales bacterium]
MRKRRRWYAAQLVLLWWASLALICTARAEPVQMVTEAWPPLLVEGESGPEGVLWEITEAVFQRMDTPVELTFLPWKRAMRQLERGHSDAILGIKRNPDRARRFQFSGVPLVSSESVILHTRARSETLDDLADLDGLRIGYSAGYFYCPEFEALDTIHRHRVPDLDAGLKMLELERIDALLMNRQVAEFYVSQDRYQGRFRASPHVACTMDLFIAFSRQTSESLIHSFDEALRQLRSSPAYQDMLRRYRNATGRS